MDSVEEKELAKTTLLNTIYDLTKKIQIEEDLNKLADLEFELEKKKLALVELEHGE